jgi:hypothetical protein
MNLITEFRDRDGNVIADFDDEGGTSVAISGNVMIVKANGTTLARAFMELDHNKVVWRVLRGARGHQIGVATDIWFSI